MRSVRSRPLRRVLLLGLLGLVASCGGSAPSEAPPAAEPEVTGPGRLEGSSFLSRVSSAAINDAVHAPGSRTPTLHPVYDVDNYRLTYLTTDGQGREVVASGLVSVPAKAAGAKSPVLSYQHATIYHDIEAPSNAVSATEPAIAVASLGYLVVAADYVGYGASKGQAHPYLLAAPSAAAVVDLLTAARTWRRKNNVADNGQLFLTGYSEGGYVSVAAFRALQTSPNVHLASLVAVVPGAGPYHVGVTLDELLRRVREQNPVLGALISPGLLRFLGGALRRQVRDALLSQLIPADADVVFDAIVLDNYLADDTAAIDSQSNVHAWAPAAPTRFFHGRDDQTVPYVSSTQTLQAMLALGAPDVSLTDCATVPSSHIGCVPDFLQFMLGEFASRARDL